MNAAGKRARRNRGNRYTAKRSRRQGNPNQDRYKNRGNLSIGTTRNPVKFVSASIPVSTGNALTAARPTFPETLARDTVKGK